MKKYQERYYSTDKGKANSIKKIQNRRNKFKNMGGPQEFISIKSKGVHPDQATYDHLNPNLPHSLLNTVLACGSCNSSKADILLFDWFNTYYCKKRNINSETISQIVLELLKKQEK